MSTTMAKPGMERKWYIIDAAGKPLGRTAEKAAVLLRGKNKPTSAWLMTQRPASSVLPVLMPTTGA